MRLFVALYLVAGWLLAVLAPTVHAAGAGVDGGTSDDFDEACYWLSRANLGRDAAYVPGEDAYGRAVAPADLGTSPIEAPEMLEFEILVDFAEDLPPQTLPTRGYQTVATVQLNPETGEMYIDGERWDEGVDHELLAACEDASLSTE